MMCVCVYIHRGTFRMERQDKKSFLIRVPPFRLESHHHDPETS